MLSRIDDFIYPGRCEVIEFGPQRFFYPIFKNASTSIIEHAKQTNLKFLINNQISKCKSIDIILRDPQERFISGVSTYVHNLLAENPDLDRTTIFYFVENYLFLDRHYAPQISWIVHLNKYMSEECKLNIQGMKSVVDYTPYQILKNENKILTAEEINRLSNNIHNQIYKNIDTYLMQLVDKSLTFSEILDYIKSKDLVAYSKLCTALD